jgi:hypothetical protein
VRVNEDRLAELRAGLPCTGHGDARAIVRRAATELVAGRAGAREGVLAADALAFLLDDLGPGIRLRVAADAVDHVSALPGPVVRELLGEAAQHEPVLGVACQAMAAYRFDGTLRPASEREEVERALYLVLRVGWVQEEVDALQESLEGVGP